MINRTVHDLEDLLMKWQGWQGWERHPVEIPGSELKRYVPLRRHGNEAKIMLEESQEEFGKEVISFYDPNSNPMKLLPKQIHPPALPISLF